MTIKEIIKAELKRLRDELVENGENTMFEQGRISALEDISVFIDSILDDTPASDDLEKEMYIFFEKMPMNDMEYLFESTFQMIAKHFVEWGKQHSK